MGDRFDRAERQLSEFDRINAAGPKGVIRGHPVRYDGSVWRHADDGSLAPFWSGGNERPCPKCGLIAEPNGPDPCIGIVPGLVSACCGHGVSEVLRVPMDATSKILARKSRASPTGDNE